MLLYFLATCTATTASLNGSKIVLDPEDEDTGAKCLAELSRHQVSVIMLLLFTHVSFSSHEYFGFTLSAKSRVVIHAQLRSLFNFKPDRSPCKPTLSDRNGRS